MRLSSGECAPPAYSFEVMNLEYFIKSVRLPARMDDGSDTSVDMTVALPRYREDIFETARGRYQLDTRTGLFTLALESSGRPPVPMRFLGSLAPSVPVQKDGGVMRLEHLASEEGAAVLRALAQGPLFGFSLRFHQDYLPFGIACELEDISYARPDWVAFSEGFRVRARGGGHGIPMELGSPITRVYRQIAKEERKYNVFETQSMRVDD